MIPIIYFWILLVLSILTITIIVIIYRNLLKISRKETDAIIEAIENSNSVWLKQQQSFIKRLKE